jgi:hypothetical protein
LEIELKNIIPRRVSIFEFLHSQGQNRKCPCLHGIVRSTLNSRRHRIAPAGPVRANSGSDRPKAEPGAEWQVAMRALWLVAEHDRPAMFARIGVIRALIRHVERVFNPSRKEPHWGRRKLARDR